jgi:hypothetical protein
MTDATDTLSGEATRTTLGARQARGGIIAGKGYSFQAAYIVSRIPLWLADPDFAQFLQEGAGDVDVRFNRAVREERWYIQVKSRVLTPAVVRGVFAQFRDIAVGSPGTYTRFILACSGINNQLRRLRTALEELRGASHFYRPEEDAILGNTWVDLEQLVQELRLPVDAPFLVGQVDFDTDLAGLTDDASLRRLFVGSLMELDQWASATPEGAARAYEKLALLCHQVLRKTFSREEIETLLRESMRVRSVVLNGERPLALVELQQQFVASFDASQTAATYRWAIAALLRFIEDTSYAGHVPGDEIPLSVKCLQDDVV